MKKWRGPVKTALIKPHLKWMMMRDKNCCRNFTRIISGRKELYSSVPTPVEKNSPMNRRIFWNLQVDFPKTLSRSKISKPMF